MTIRTAGSLARILRANFRVAFAVVLEYRAAILLYLLAGVTPLLMMFIWRHLAADRPIGGRDPDAFSLYFLLAFLCIQSTLAWPVWNIDYYIRSGTYTVQLLRPYDPWFTELIENIATNCLRFPINLAIVAAGITLTDTWSSIDLGRLPVFALALLLSWQVMFNLNYALALLSFWTERIKAADSWLSMMLHGLGGALFPLDLLWPTFRTIIDLTPFPWVIGFPVELLIGGADPWRGLAMQALWVGIGVACHRMLWARGLNRFGAVGG